MTISNICHKNCLADTFILSYISMTNITDPTSTHLCTLLRTTLFLCSIYTKIKRKEYTAINHSHHHFIQHISRWKQTHNAMIHHHGRHFQPSTNNSMNGGVMGIGSLSTLFTVRFCVLLFGLLTYMFRRPQRRNAFYFFV